MCDFPLRAVYRKARDLLRSVFYRDNVARDYICEANSETVHTKARGINDLVFHMASGFSLFYGLLLGLLTVAAYQNLEEVRQNVFGQASALAYLYRDVSSSPAPHGSELR